MIIAVVSDIHGNLPALEAAVADASGRGAEEFFCAGDLTGYGPFPSEVSAFVENMGMRAISGNYDRKAIEAMDGPEKLRKKMKPGKWRILDWTRTHLGPGAEAFLRGLEGRLLLRLRGGHSMLVVHGSPVSDEDTVYPSVTAAGLARKLGPERPDILVCGHTHIPFAKRVGGMLVVNAGSAGMPVDGDARPSYALIGLGRGRMPSCRIVRFSYAVERVTDALAASALPKGLCRDFADGNKKRETP